MLLVTSVFLSDLIEASFDKREKKEEKKSALLQAHTHWATLRHES